MQRPLPPLSATSPGMCLAAPSLGVELGEGLALCTQLRRPPRPHCPRTGPAQPPHPVGLTSLWLSASRAFNCSHRLPCARLLGAHQTAPHLLPNLYLRPWLAPGTPPWASSIPSWDGVAQLSPLPGVDPSSCRIGAL